MPADVLAAIGIHTVEPIPPITTTTSSPEGPLAQGSGLSEPDEGPDGPSA